MGFKNLNLHILLKRFIALAVDDGVVVNDLNKLPVVVCSPKGLERGCPNKELLPVPNPDAGTLLPPPERNEKPKEGEGPL